MGERAELLDSSQMVVKQRTLRQNRSLHLLMNHIADGLNESGLSMMRVLKHNAEIPWTPEAAKEYLLRPIIIAMYNKSSTKELTTKEIGDAIDVLCGHLVMATGKVFEMPSLETLMNQDRVKHS
jgi:hypothetical protein